MKRAGKLGVTEKRDQNLPMTFRLFASVAVLSVLVACSGDGGGNKDSGVAVDVCAQTSGCSAENELTGEQKAACEREQKSVCGARYEALIKCGRPHVVCTSDNKIDTAKTQDKVIMNCGVLASAYLACTVENPVDSGTPDSGTDAGTSDAGTSDAGRVDGGSDGG